MAQNRQALKSRIRSTQATMKITSAMELMSNSKLQRQRSMMEKNREYSTTLLKTLHHILSESDQVENKYLRCHVLRFDQRMPCLVFVPLVV